VREEVNGSSAKAPVAGPDLAFRMDPLPVGPRAEKPKGGWAKFQARFKKKQYSQI
jgi:hypothetical protein